MTPSFRPTLRGGFRLHYLRQPLRRRFLHLWPPPDAAPVPRTRHRRQHVEKQTDAVVQADLTGVARSIDDVTVDALKDYGCSASTLAVEESRDVRMLQSRQQRAFALEAPGADPPEQ